MNYPAIHPVFPPRPRERRFWYWVDCILLTAAVLALTYAGVFYFRAWYGQMEGNSAGAWTAPLHTSQPPKEGTPLGRLEVPKIGLSAVIFEGTTEDTLSYGVGHYSGSAFPGVQGNTVFAAHRDTFFRPLRNIRTGDRMVVTTSEGTFRYVVESTAIVFPDQTSVLRSTAEPSLTLITCYPFQYIGSAPQRFVVRARALERASTNHAAVTPGAEPQAHASVLP